MYLIIILLLTTTIHLTNQQQQLFNCDIIRPPSAFNYVIANCSTLNPMQINWTLIQKLYITDLLLSSSPYLSINFQATVQQINLCDSLKLLDLSSNNLNEQMNGNDLRRIDCSANYLKTLILSSNAFTSIPILSSSCMSSIEVLYLNNNKNLINFDRLNDSTGRIDFQTMNALKYLDISNSNIETINGNSKSILQFMPNLIYLNLRNNRIKQIFETPFQWVPKLTHINLDNNLLNCNFDSLWFKYYLLNTKLKYLQITTSTPYDNYTLNSTLYSPVCAYTLLMLNNTISQSNQQTLLTQLDDNLFFTPVNLTTNLTSQNIQLNKNDMIDLFCLVYSIPESEINWMFNDRELSRITNNDGEPYLIFDNILPTTRQLQIPRDSVMSFKNATKYSVLRILNINKTYEGVYACRTSYTIDSIRKLMTRNLTFSISVKNPPEAKVLTTGEIIGVVFGCIIGFLLILIILALIIYFICYKRRLLCFKPEFKSKVNKTLFKSSSSSSAANKYYANQKGDFNSSGGFHDDTTYTKPNYLTQPSIIYNTNANNNNNNSLTTTTTNTITNSSYKSLNQQNFDSMDNNNVYNVNNPQRFYHQSQQDFDALYSLNNDTTNQPQPLNYRTVVPSQPSQPKQALNTLNNGIYFPQQQQNLKILQEDILIENDNNIDNYYPAQYIPQQIQSQQQQQQQFSNLNNSFLKYDSDV